MKKRIIGSVLISVLAALGVKKWKDVQDQKEDWSAETDKL